MLKTKSAPEINLTNQCYDYIQENIINGTFEPGKKLKVEELKDQIQSGASPVREALSRLINSGLVEARDNKGFYVTRISESDIRDLYHTFLQIELLALTQAIKCGDDAWKTSIVATLYNLSLIEKDSQKPTYTVWAERNYAFHVALIAGCNSPTLLEIRAHLYRRFDRYCRIAFNLSHTNLLINHKEHQKLAEAILDKNTEKAIALMTHHILGPLEDVVKLLKKYKMF